MPVITSLIDSGSNFEVALDLIANANDLIETKLENISLVQVYKERLKEQGFRCKKRLEAECLSQIQQFLSSKI